MSKNKNVCLGRRGRPKKNQNKPRLNDFVSALCETEDFSFFPMSREKIMNGNYNVSKVSSDFRFSSMFREWYLRLESKLGGKDYLKLPKTNCEDTAKDFVKVNLNEYSCELNCGEVVVHLNKGVHTKSTNIPYLMFVKGHVWKMAFSPPILLNDLNGEEFRRLNASLKALYLSMGIHPQNSPLTQINKRYDEKGTIQIWEIPYVDCDDKEVDGLNGELSSMSLSPSLKYEIQHNGLICRYMEWIPTSNNDKGIVGILFCVLGDGNSYLLSIPSCESDSSVSVDAESLVIWKYSDVFTVISGSVCIQSIDSDLKICATTAEGVLLIWTFESSKRNSDKSESDVNSTASMLNIEASQQVIVVSKSIPLLCSCWCPINSSYLISVCSSNGTIYIVDFRKCNNHIIREFELSNRPITSVNWCRLTNNLLISHGIGAIMLSIENGDYTQFSIEAFIKKRKYSIYDNFKYPVLGSRSWTCDSLLHYAIFGFNDGSTVIGPCFEFGSKSFQDTLLIKTFVSSDLGSEDNTNCDDGCKKKSNNNSDLFSSMEELVTCDYNHRLNKMKSGTINVYLNHSNDECNAKNMTDFLEVHYN
ncbi:hypothetical protein FG386_002991 [Cryptosporidium ryanae]|uniref:uncharacterized protein n=1 Tax=Cryptosporidium ryanae TaxID=515981 RepID=UPI00351A1743|nr:hypothetical protein FG386_002991 [Cryptosporidium ryanae]